MVSFIASMCVSAYMDISGHESEWAEVNWPAHAPWSSLLDLLKLGLLALGPCRASSPVRYRRVLYKPEADLQLLSSQHCSAMKRQRGWVMYVPASQRKSFPDWQFSWALMISICISADKNHGLIFRSAQKYHGQSMVELQQRPWDHSQLGPFHASLPLTKLQLFHWVCGLQGILESQPLDGWYDYKGRSETVSLRYDIWDSCSDTKGEAASTCVGHYFCTALYSPYNAQQPSRLSPSVWFLLSSFAECIKHNSGMYLLFSVQFHLSCPTSAPIHIALKHIVPGWTKESPARDRRPWPAQQHRGTEAVPLHMVRNVTLNVIAMYKWTGAFLLNSITPSLDI